MMLIWRDSCSRKLAAIMRNAPPSPSVPTKRLAKALTTRSHGFRSRGTVAATRRLYEGTTLSFTLEDSPFRQSDTLSDDTLSTFSCVGDCLPDDATDVNLIDAAGTDNEMVAVKRIANILAKRRKVDVNIVLPKLLSLFSLDQVDHTLDQVNHTPGMMSNTGLRKKASMPGFFSRTKPQLHVDTSIRRRFSFEPGDDEASLSATPSDNLPAAVRDRLLRKTVSMSVLSETPQKAMPDSELSPLPQSPTSSALASDSKRPSRIPTPNCNSLARPRRERDDSSSSLLTAIKHCDDVSRRSGSLSSSSSPSASRIDMKQGGQQGVPLANNPLLEHTNALRGSVLAVSATKIDIDPGELQHGTRRSLRRSRATACPRDENVAL